jgi:predicted membrane protein
MTRQVQNPQGHVIKPLHATLFVLALLVFIVSVVYRMAKSESFNTAMATLFESLLIVSFVIFLGMLFAYLIYFLHERVQKGPHRLPLGDETAGKPDPNMIGREPSDEVKSQPNS